MEEQQALSPLGPILPIAPRYVTLDGIRAHTGGPKVMHPWCSVLGTYAEYAVALAERVVSIPDDVTFEQAAAALLGSEKAVELNYSQQVTPYWCNLRFSTTSTSAPMPHWRTRPFWVSARRSIFEMVGAP